MGHFDSKPAPHRPDGFVFSTVGLLSLSALVMLAWSCSGNAVSGALEERSGDAHSVDPSSDAKPVSLFATHCARCHVGENAFGPKLDLIVTRFDDAELSSLLRVGQASPLMPTFMLSDSEMANLTLELRAMFGPYTQVMRTREQLFECYCAHCHGADGRGARGPNLFLRVPHLADAQIEEQITLQGRRQHGISKSEIDRLRAYVRETFGQQP